jgi:hypothetical protein
VVAVEAVKAVLVVQAALALLHKQALVVDTAQVVLHLVTKLDLLLVLELAFLTQKLVLIVACFAVKQYLLVAVLAVQVDLAVRVKDISNLNLVVQQDLLGHQVGPTLELVALVALAVMVVFLAQVGLLEQQALQVLTAMQEAEQRVVMALL